MEWFVLVPNSQLNARLSSDHIDSLLQKLVYKNYKYYERQIKQYIKNDLFYEIILNQKDIIDEIRCYTKVIEDYKQDKPGIMQLKIVKHKKPIHAFSSSIDINDIRFIKRLTFRVSNRVFINFDAIEDYVGDSYNMIFVNANCDANVDCEYVLSEAEHVLNLLQL